MSDTKSQILSQEDRTNGTQAAVVQQAGNQLPVNDGSAVVEPAKQNDNVAPVNDGSAVVEPAKQNDNVAPVQVGSVQNQSSEQQTTQVEQKSAAADAALQGKAEVQNQPGLAKPQQEPQQLTYQQMFSKLNPYAPPTPEEVEKEKKRERREKIFSAIGDGVSALANLYFASQGAQNMYDPEHSMSKKVNDHWDKLRKERQDNAYKFSNAMLNAARLDEERKNGDRNYQLAITRHEDSKNQWQQQFDEQKRHNAAGEQLAREKAQQEHDLAVKKFDEGVRQFNVSSQQQAQRIRQEGARLQQQAKQNKFTFALGEGKGTIDIDKDALNSANVSYVFSKLPAEIRDQVKGDAITDKLTGQVAGYKDPSTEAMLIAIGANIQDCTGAQDALREIAGKKPQGKKGGFNNGQGKTGGFKK